jgi:hypothetical protein
MFWGLTARITMSAFSTALRLSESVFTFRVERRILSREASTSVTQTSSAEINRCRIKLPAMMLPIFPPPMTTAFFPLNIGRPPIGNSGTIKSPD